MNKNEMSLDSFLDEFEATLSQEDSQAILRRINAERLLHLLAESLNESLPENQIRFLPDKRMAGVAGADFLMQVDDYDIRLQLLDAPDGRPGLDKEQLPGYLTIMEGNPNTVALVLIWTTDELSAVPLSIRRIRFLLEKPDRLSSLMNKLEPVEDVLTKAVREQVKQWDVSLDPPPGIIQETTDLRQAFASALAKAMTVEKGRRYQLPARKSAAEKYPRVREKTILMNALDLALSGVAGDPLIDALSELDSFDDLKNNE